MVDREVSVDFIELLNTVGNEHHEVRLMGETFPYYPPYKEGDTLFIQYTQKGLLNDPIKHTQFKIVDVHHSLNTHKKGWQIYADVNTHIVLTVYLRKVD